MERTTVVLAGATAWAGSELARGIAAAPDLALVGAVSRAHAGKRLGEVLGIARLDTPIRASASEAPTQRCGRTGGLHRGLEGVIDWNAAAPW